MRYNFVADGFHTKTL